MMNVRLLSLLMMAALFSFSCKQNQPPAQAEEAPPPAAEEEVKDASMASVPGKSDPACVGPIAEGTPETVTIGGETFERSGHALTLTSAREGADGVKVGVIANMNQATAPNLFNIQRYLSHFKENGVELILVAGDSGEERADIEAVLSAVAESGLPVLAIAGNREKTTDFVAAVESLRETKPNVLNGNEIRLLSWGGLDVITLPGYHDSRYIHQEPGHGCRYFSDDVWAVEKLASASENPVLLLAHGQPKGTTPTALDVIAPGKEHIGDENLNKAIEKANIPFGIFANVKETGGTGIADLAGEEAVEEAAWSETLYFNPGAADAVEWAMNDGGTSTGMVGIFQFKDGKGSYSLYRAPKLTDAERAEGAKLLPGAAAQAE